MLTKIISGGQTGADRGGLDAALHCDWPHGGWCPKGRKAEEGIIPFKYHLNEMASSEYLPRTKANVFDSDATIIFSYGPLSGGSLQTATYACLLKKPHHEVDLFSTTSKTAINELMLFLASNEKMNDNGENAICPPPLPYILNVAGSRKAKHQVFKKPCFK